MSAVIDLRRDDGCGHFDPACGHYCGELFGLAIVSSELIDAIDRLVSAWKLNDGKIWPLFQAQSYFDQFVELHPSVELQNVIDGVRANAKALNSRAELDNG